jgi:sporulation protein YlmC with PRC-barrel domain
MRLEFGKQVRCTDAVVGELADVVIDPIEKRVTHLVVRPHHRRGHAWLVPIDLADSGVEDDVISLRCTAEEVAAMPDIENFAFLRTETSLVSDPEWDVGVTDVLALPYYESAGFDYMSAAAQDVELVYDRVPKGEVEIRRASSVMTADGEYVGSVDGFLVDGGDITHFVLERGHLWGRREVTVPIGAVEKVESDTVTLGLSTDEVGALPAHRVHRWPWDRGRAET